MRKLIACLTLCLLCAMQLAAAREAAYGSVQPSRDGIGKTYMGREIAQVMGYPGADWLERGSREREERPELLLAALGLAPGMAVADVGAGTGYYAGRIAGKIGDNGRVYAVDVQPQMLSLLEQNMRRRGVSNVQPVLGTGYRHRPAGGSHRPGADGGCLPRAEPSARNPRQRPR